MLKIFLLKAWSVILSPATAWKKIIEDKSEDEKQILQYALILILCCVAATFVSGLFAKGNFRFVHAFVRAIVTGIVCTGTLWGVFYLLTTSLRKWLNFIPDRIICLQLTVYSTALLFFVDIVTVLIPPLFFLKILNAYTIYIIWEGVGACFNFEEKHRGNLAMLLSAGVLLLPFAIEKILLFILPIAR